MLQQQLTREQDTGYLQGMEEAGSIDLLVLLYLSRKRAPQFLQAPAEGIYQDFFVESPQLALLILLSV